MITPPRPANETARLKRLRALGILDTPTEERFDVVTRLAKKLFRADIAIVSLVDDERQWFKSCDGLDATETPRDVAFCAYTILSDDVMVVEDATKDPRFCGNPLVTGEPHIRFYAGYPISTEGVNIGTLCIIAKEPREFSEMDVKMLADLGGLAEREIRAMEEARIDENTGLVNRRGLYVTGENLLSVSRQTGGPVSVLFFDLNGFKEVNDTYGHEAGDELLNDFGVCVSEAFSTSNVVARLGGDEFCVLLATSAPDDLKGHLNLLSSIVAAKNASYQDGRGISYAVGISSFDPERHEDFSDLLRDADERMYQAKGRSTGRAA